MESATPGLSVTRTVTSDIFLVYLSKVVLWDRIKPIAVITTFDIYACNQV
jgi:hypothetical protein